MNRKNLIAISVAAVVVVALIIIGPRLFGGSEGETADAGSSGAPAAGQQAPPLEEGAEMPSDHPSVDGATGEAGAGNTEAVAAAEKAYEENPQDLQVLLDLGKAYLGAARADDATKIFNEALAVDPESSDAKAGLAMAKFTKGDASGAQADLEKVTAEDPENQTAFYDLAVVYFSSQQRDKAQEAWEKAAAIDSSSELGRLAAEFLNLMSSTGGSSGNE
jgi:cytochrome c-type biogenesis protein CcmH/NrfG